MVDYTKQTGTQLDGMISFDPSGVGVEWAHLVTHILADWQANVDNGKWGNDLNFKISSIANQLANGLIGFPNVVQPGSMPPDGSTPVSACVDLVAGAFTSSGAQQMILGLSGQGLAAGAAEVSDIATKAAQKVVGSVLADTAKFVQGAGGALTATGVGAVVGVAASLAGGVLGAIFGSPSPPPYQVGNCGLSDKPTIVSKYAWTYGGIVDGGPGNPDWRHFPDRARKGDSRWFDRHTYQRAGSAGLIRYPGGGKMQLDNGGGTVSTDDFPWDGSRTRLHVDTWYGCYTYPGDSGTRPIDHAMYDNGQDGAYGGTVAAAEQSVFYQLEQELLTASITGVPAAQFKNFRRFQEAFVKAWKQNREFALNGCKMQPDWKVLDKVVSIWNQANGPQQTLRIPAPSAQPDMLSAWAMGATPKSMPSYVQYLLYRYNGSMQSVQGADGAIVLNMGAIKDISVGGLLPAGSLHLIGIHLTKKPAAAAHLIKLGVSPVAIAQLRAYQAARGKPKRRYFFGATLTGVAAGALAGGPLGALGGAAVGGAVDLARAHHEKEGKWL